MKETVTIELEYGSDWQRESNRQMLDAMLVAFTIHFESKHKKNEIDVRWEVKT